MFENVGGKIRKLAMILFALGCCGALAGAIALWSMDADVLLKILLGFAVLIAGILLSYVSTLFVYGFGQLIEDTECIHMEIIGRRMAVQQPVMPAPVSQRPLPPMPPVVAGTPAPVRQTPLPSMPPWENGTPPPRRVWRCPKCGELNEPGLAACENCGEER